MFYKKQQLYSLGAIENPLDPRDVQISTFQNISKSIPKKHITDISFLPVFDQKKNGSCVGQALALAVSYFDHKEGIRTDASPRYIYGLAKRMDGLMKEGTYPRIGGNILVNLGCATQKTVPSVETLTHSQYISFSVTPEIEKDALPRKIKGYAFANANINELKNAIINNGVVCASLTVGNWNRQPVKAGNGGRHYILIYGYDGDRFFFRNSWGERWGKNGDGFFDWKDHQNTIRDIMVITDIPNKVLEKAKSEWRWGPYFKPNERTGNSGTVSDLEPILLDMLLVARIESDIPYVLVSGYRTPEYNQKVGGKPNSAHLRKLAVDISAITGEQKFKIIKGLIVAGFTRIGVHKTFIHADCDPSLPQEVIWLY